jgi:hypothetical protein
VLVVPPGDWGEQCSQESLLTVTSTMDCCCSCQECSGLCGSSLLLWLLTKVSSSVSSSCSDRLLLWLAIAVALLLVAVVVQLCAVEDTAGSNYRS